MSWWTYWQRPIPRSELGYARGAFPRSLQPVPFTIGIPSAPSAPTRPMPAPRPTIAVTPLPVARPMLPAPQAAVDVIRGDVARAPEISPAAGARGGRIVFDWGAAARAVPGAAQLARAGPPGILAGLVSVVTRAVRIQAAPLAQPAPSRATIEEQFRERIAAAPEATGAPGTVGRLEFSPGLVTFAESGAARGLVQTGAGIRTFETAALDLGAVEASPPELALPAETIELTAGGGYTAV